MRNIKMITVLYTPYAITHQPSQFGSAWWQTNSILQNSVMNQFQHSIILPSGFPGALQP
jgi:hypothetical protein